MQKTTLWEQWLQEPGEHALMLPGIVGPLEAVLSVPPQPIENRMVFLGHPNPLQGGTMNNKVVTTLARVCRELSLPSLRMNFRGTGQSSGQFDAGLGESEDMLALLASWQRSYPQGLPLFAGFSFGSYVCFLAAAQTKNLGLLSIAPAMDRQDYQLFSLSSPWEILMGDADEVVPFPLVQEFADRKELPLHILAGAGHFFHGRLLELRSIAQSILRNYLR